MLVFSIGVVLFVVAIIVNQPIIFNPVTALFMLGWAIPYVALGRRSKAAVTPVIIALPLLLALGLFYFMASHVDHIQSGLGFGLDHTAHNSIGFLIIVVTEVLTLAAAMRSKSG